MYIDNGNVFSDSQDLSGGTGSIESSYLKLADSGIDFGQGSVLKLKMAVETAITASTNMDFTMQIAECATTNGTYTTVVESAELSGADTQIDSGEVFTLPMPPGDRKQYLKAIYTVKADTNASTLSPGAGVVTAWLTNE